MDLAKIKRMIEAGSIETLLQLKDHTLLMFTNAIMFNTTGHHVNQAAKDLLRQSAKILREAQYAAGELSDLSPSPKSRRSAITSIMSARAMRSGTDTPKLNSVTVSHSPTPSDISTTEQGSFLAPAARATPPAQKMPRSRFGMPPTLRANSSEPTEAEDANAKRRIFGRKLLQNSVYKIPAPKSNI
ncbi:bromodomain-containing protein [Ditylenchus destructor]|nr:bromodomain-containing protein [Ditylenchus destructor]